MTGKVKWFNEEKGYGFLLGNDGSETFVHFTAIKGDGFKTLKQDQLVSYDVVKGQKGNQATNIVIQK